MGRKSMESRALRTVTPGESGEAKGRWRVGYHGKVAVAR